MNDNQEEMVSITTKTDADMSPKIVQMRKMIRMAEEDFRYAMDELVAIVETENSFEVSLIEKVAALFVEEKNKPNQAQFYRKMIVKLFGYDKALLTKAAEALGFWVKDVDGRMLLSWALSKRDVDNYGLKE